MRTTGARLVGVVCAATVVLAGCGGEAAGPAGDGASSAPGAGSDGPLAVVASFYPLEWMAERLGGDQVSVTGLTPVGVEPHDLVLDPDAREAVDNAGVVLYLGSSFQPDVERAVGARPQGVEAVDLLTSPGLELLEAPGDLGKESLDGGRDPHVWLDPVRMSAMAGRIAEALVAVRPELEDSLRVRLAAVQSDLATLDRRLGAALAQCERRTIVTSHAAFGYLADRYRLDQLAIAGISPEAEPDPATLREVADGARRAGVTTVFFEEALPPDLAQTVADEVGADTDLLGALEFDPEAAVGPGEDYLTVMRRNGDALSRGLGCAT